MNKTLERLSDLMRTMKDDFVSIQEYQELHDIEEIFWGELEFYCDYLIEEIVESSFKDDYELADEEFERLFSSQNTELIEEYQEYENDIYTDLKYNSYQSFVVSERDAKQLNKYSEIVLHDNECDIYIWQKYHYGMPYNHIKVSLNKYSI